MNFPAVCTAKRQRNAGGYQLLLIVQTARGVRGYRVEEVYEEVVTEERGPAPDDIAIHSAQPSYLDTAVDDLESGFIGQDAGAQAGVGGWNTALPVGSSISAAGRAAQDTEAALAAADATGIDLHVERFTGQAPAAEVDDLALVEDDDTVV